MSDFLQPTGKLHIDEWNIKKKYLTTDAHTHTHECQRLRFCVSWRVEGMLEIWLSRQMNSIRIREWICSAMFNWVKLVDVIGPSSGFAAQCSTRGHFLIWRNWYTETGSLWLLALVRRSCGLFWGLRSCRMQDSLLSRYRTVRCLIFRNKKYFVWYNSNSCSEFRFW